MDIRERIKNVIVKNLIESKLEEQEDERKIAGVTPSQVLANRAKQKASLKRKIDRTAAGPDSDVHNPNFGKPASQAPPVRPETDVRGRSSRGGREGRPGLES